jgi:CO/xanthine dehydrogenase Mo-binding subunit
VNPNLAGVQVCGAVAQGIGLCLFEELSYSEDGRVGKVSYQDYKIPSQMDIPYLQTVFEPSYEPTGPFGAKSIGEVAISSAAPAIVDAVYNATGVHIDSLPITPEKMFRALWKAEKGSELE